MEFNKTTVKHLLLTMNFIFTILALVQIGFGIYLLVGAKDNKVDHGETIAGGLIISLAITVLAAALFGSLAAIHEAKRRLLIFVVVLCLLILVQLLMSSIATRGSRDGLSGSIRQGFDELWLEESATPGALAYYEDWLKCCGVHNFTDYPHHSLPKTCYKDHNVSVVENIYQDGCLKKFEDYIFGKMIVFRIVNCFLLIVEVVAAIFAWLLYRHVKKETFRAHMRWL